MDRSQEINSEKSLIFEKVEQKLEKLFGTSSYQTNSNGIENFDVLKENEVLSVLIDPDDNELDSVEENMNIKPQHIESK